MSGWPGVEKRVPLPFPTVAGFAGSPKLSTVVSVHWIEGQADDWGGTRVIQGLYAAALGMLAMEARQALIANNIANASTPGFRRQDGVQKGFYSVFAPMFHTPAYLNSRKGPGGGTQMVETFTDFSGGVITSTGDPLNIALSGPGFMAVDAPQGERFSRNGKLTIDGDGHLATLNGCKVQNVTGGYIDIRGGRVEIDEEGIVKVDNAPTGQIRLVEFENPHLLNREGEDLYRASEAALRRSALATGTRVFPEAIETSNVQLPIEMIDLLMGLRAYAANQKVIASFEDTITQLIERVGSPI